jgi:hypothetical protein
MSATTIKKISASLGTVFTKPDHPAYVVIGVNDDKISIRIRDEPLANVFESTVEKLINEGYAVAEDISFEVSTEAIKRQMKSPEGMLIPCPPNPRDDDE